MSYQHATQFTGSTKTNNVVRFSFHNVLITAIIH